MRTASWDECVERAVARRATPDREKARSLVETARARIAFVEGGPLTEGSASVVFEGYYTSALELVHALVVASGHRVENHLCLGYYLRDVLGRRDLFRTFDDGRFKRNALVYYGKRMDPGVARGTIGKLKRFVGELEDLVGEALGQE